MYGQLRGSEQLCAQATNRILKDEKVKTAISKFKKEAKTNLDIPFLMALVPKRLSEIEESIQVRFLLPHRPNIPQRGTLSMANPLLPLGRCMYLSTREVLAVRSHPAPPFLSSTVFVGPNRQTNLHFNRKFLIAWGLEQLNNISMQPKLTLKSNY